jgi:hypothetical protein
VADTSGYGWADDIGYAVTRAVGGVAPRARPLVLNANGKPLSVGTLVENVNADFLLDRWGHADFDLVKTKPPRLKLGSRDGIEKYQLFLKQRVASGDATRRAVERFVDVDSLTAWMLPLILCEASEGGKHVRREAFQGFTFLDRRRKEKSIGFIAWDMDHGFINAGYDTLNGVLTRCPFMTHVGTFRAMLRDDPSYRADFVRRAQEALNHVFRPDRWLPAVDAYAEFYRRHAAHYEEGDEGRPPTDSEVAACRAGWEEKFDAARRLLRDRPGMLWDHVRGQFDLPPPLPVRVTAAGPATVRIDGHLETLPYEGRYFPGSTLALDAGGAAASRVRGFVVNGVKLAARRMERRVDSELAVEVLPAEAGQGQEASGRP